MLDERQLLALLSLPGIGRATGRAILEASGHGPIDMQALVDLIGSMKLPSRGHAKPQSWELERALSKADQVLERCGGEGIQVIASGAAAFPQRLALAHDTPLLLFVRGPIPALSRERAVAVIGTRTPSPAGFSLAAGMAAVLSDIKASVVSGLALGCDTAAHQGCLEAGGVTIAVLAHGLDMIYPAENAGLAERIVLQGGCLVSEYPPSTRPTRGSYIDRDRIQSGLSDLVLVIESSDKGGSMHTARFALQQGRRLACVSPEALGGDAPSSRGNQTLLDEHGAWALTVPEDLIPLVQSLAPRPHEKGPAAPLVADEGSTQLPLL